jgi:hypothetical protein
MSNVTLVRVVPALLAALLLAVAAGCGSARQAGNAASAVPADVAAYVSMDTSFQGSQWRAVRDLLGKFPDGEGALDDLLDEAAEEAGLAEGDGLRDALGPEVAVAVLGVPARGEEAPVVLLTQPDDEDAFADLLAGAKAAHAEVNGWQVVAEDEATLERYRDSLDGPSLEGSAAFQEAMDDLDPEALVHAYVNGKSVLQALVSQPGLPAGALPLPAGGGLGSIGATLAAEGDGLRVEGRLVPGEGSDAAVAAEPYEAELPDRVPGGVLAYVSFHDLGSSLGAAAGAGQGLLPLDLGIAELFAGESALYVRPGKPQPSVTLVTEVDDEAAALETAKGLLGLAGKQAGMLSVDAFDGLLVASTSKAEIAALRDDGPRLAADDDFDRALDRSGVPDETTGFGYVDLQAIVPLFLGLAEPAGGKANEAREYLEPLSSAVFWGSASGSAQHFSLFVGID